MFFYRRLWREAERDRRQADARVQEMGLAVMRLLDALAVDDHSNPEVRGMVRRLRRVAEREWS